MPDKDQNPPPGQPIEGNQQNISGQVTGPAVGGNVGQIGHVFNGPVYYQSGEKAPEADPNRRFFVVDFLRNPDFVGRDADLASLHAALAGDEAVAIQSAGSTDLPGFPKPGRSDAPAGLTGQGGMGKTALAVEYCHRHRDDYPGGVFWVNAAESLAQGFASLGCLLDPANLDRPVPRQIDAAARYLHSHPDALLVLDNVEEPATLTRPVATGLIPTELACRVLFTTRRRDLPARCRPVEVTVLPVAAALALLLRHPARRPIQQPGHPQHAQAQRICRRLGYLPLALEIAGAFLGEWPAIGLAEFGERLDGEGALSTLDEEGGYLSPANLPAIHAAAVTATLRTQWEALNDENARLLLRIAGQLPEAAQIPTARLGLLAGLDGDERPGRPSRLQRALRRLDALSLIEELRGEELRLHPLVREFAAGQTPADERDDFRTACAENLYRTYSDFVTLESHCAQRGVASLEGDLQMALFLFSNHQSWISDFLRILLRLLQLESHNLRLWDFEQEPVRFARLFNNLAAKRGANPVAESAARRVAQLLGHSILTFKWRTDHKASKVMRTLTGHASSVLSVVVTPDGRRVVSASDDRTLRVWNLEDGTQEQLLSGYEGYVQSVAMTPNGRLVITASSDRTLRVWDLESGTEEQTLLCYNSLVRSVTVTPDGRKLVTASSDRTVRIWNLETGAEEKMLAGHGSRVRSAVVTPDGRQIVSVSSDRTLRVWDLQSGAEERVLIGHERPVNAVAVTPDSQRAISASGDRTLRVWDLRSGKEERILTGHTDTVWSVAVTPDGRRAISASSDRTLRVWDLQSGAEELVLTGHEVSVLSVAVTPDGKRAVSASDDCTMRVWNISTQINTNIESRTEDRVLIGHKSSILSITVTPDSRRAVSASSDHTMRIWNLETGTEERVLAGHGGNVQSVAVTPDSKRAVSASSDRTLRIWNLETGAEEQVLVGHTLPVRSVAVTPDGRHAVSASDDHTLRIWDLQSQVEERILPGHMNTVWSVAVMPDGRLAIFASGYRDAHTVRVWDFESGAEEQVLFHNYYELNDIGSVQK